MRLAKRSNARREKVVHNYAEKQEMA